MIAWSFGILGLAALLGWLAGPAGNDATPAGAVRGAALLSRASWALNTAGSVLLVIVGAAGLAGHGGRVDVADILGTIGLHVDPVSGLFLVIAFGVAAPICFAALAGPVSERPRLPSAVAYVLLATALTLCAGDLFLLLAGWESLGFAFYLAVGFERWRPGRSWASLLAVGFSKASGAALLIGGMLLVAQSHTLQLARLGDHATGAGAAVAYLLLVFGFATKAGLVPLHVWLPPTYVSAPGPVRAILAGVAANIGFYGLWRTLDMLGTPPIWLAGLVLLVAGIGAILGISHGAVHADLRHLIAWSSVENAGLIIAGYGVALVGAASHSTAMTAAGLIAGTLQVCTHALGKSVLFVAAGDLEEALGTMELDRVRGVLRSRTVSGVGLMVGCLTLAGLPLTAGFASEWLTLEALMQQFRTGSLTLQVCTAIGAALVALTTGVAAFTFVRVIGLSVFARPATSVRPEAPRATWSHAVAVTLLSLGCLAGAAFAPLLVHLAAQGVVPIVGRSGFGALAGSWVVQPVYPGFSALSPSWLWIVIPGITILVAAMGLLFSRRRLFAVRRVPAWASGTPVAPNRIGYSSFGFANPMRTVLSSLLRTRRSLQPATTGHARAEAASGAGRPEYAVEIVDVVGRYLYRPFVPALRAVVHAAKRLQSGRLDAYMAYMLIALLAVIGIVAAVSAR